MASLLKQSTFPLSDSTGITHSTLLLQLTEPSNGTPPHVCTYSKDSSPHPNLCRHLRYKPAVCLLNKMANLEATHQMTHHPLRLGKGTGIEGFPNKHLTSDMTQQIFEASLHCPSKDILQNKLVHQLRFNITLGLHLKRSPRPNTWETTNTLSVIWMNRAELSQCSSITVADAAAADRVNGVLWSSCGSAAVVNVAHLRNLTPRYEHDCLGRKCQSSESRQRAVKEQMCDLVQIAVPASAHLTVRRHSLCFHLSSTAGTLVYEEEDHHSNKSF
ncbi:hypothetical protein PAMP_008169 [Pampus punctatissimus]